MAKIVADLTHKQEQIITGKDNVVMPVVFETIENGRSLDVSDFKGEYILGGHVIIKKDGEAIYKPMPIKADGSGYEAKPAGFSIAGYQCGTILKERPLGAIMIRGTYVTEAAPYPVDAILTDLKEATPLVHFKTKED